MSSTSRSTSRRQFLKWLSASPVLACPGLEGRAQGPAIWAPASAEDLIARPEDAINVFDFERVAQENVPPAHFGYLASGIDDEVTLRANREAFLNYYLRPRRLNDVSEVDMSMDIFGVKYDSPIILAPIGDNKGYHPDGEVAVARAAKVGNHLEILATGSSTSIEEAMEARGAPIWFQLYATSEWEVAEALVKRVETAGSPVVVVTVDRVGGRNQETRIRLERRDTRDCSQCHPPPSGGSRSRNPMYDGIDLSGVRSFQSANMTWDFIHRLRDATSMKIVIKGILTHEDAALCVENGVDGLIVSNHGGRAEDSGRATIDCLAEIVEVVQKRITVLVDSGFRRGTDVVKALAMGADGVCVGRPYMWGLGAFGQPGVERVLEILRIETQAATQQCGASSIGELTPALVGRAA